MDRSDILALADAHESQAFVHAQQAVSRQSWHSESQKAFAARQAADHFAIASHLRKVAGEP